MRSSKSSPEHMKEIRAARTRTSRANDVFRQLNLSIKGSGKSFSERSIAFSARKDVFATSKIAMIVSGEHFPEHSIECSAR
jgi:hypothetical protein